MNKKVLIILLICSHLLCAMLGFCFGTGFERELPMVESTEATIETTKGEVEKPTEFLEEATYATEMEEVTQETIYAEETEEIEKVPSASKPPETVPPTESKPSASVTPKPTDPPATTPPATVPPITEPPMTNPPATEPPATQPPATLPEPDIGAGGLPII